MELVLRLFHGRIERQINLFSDTLPKANTKDKIKPIGSEIINKSNVLSNPAITSIKFLYNKI